MKKEYAELETEVIRFADDDVIATSTQIGGGEEDDD